MWKQEKKITCEIQHSQRFAQFDCIYELTPASTRIMGVLTGDDDEGKAISRELPRFADELGDHQIWFRVFHILHCNCQTLLKQRKQSARV